MKKIIIGSGLFLIVLISFFVFDKNDVSSIKVINYNGNNLMVSIDGVSADTLPTDGNYYLVDYDCKSKNTVISWDKEKYELKVSNRNKEANVTCNLEFETNPKLADMEAGSYVKYVGTNGCSGESCNGKNANYVNDSNMGYCNNSNNKFMTNGWRIAYSKNNTAYLVSAGSPECVCINNDGSISNKNCLNSYTANTDVVSVLNDYSLRYCNKNYAYDGMCNGNSTWAMNDSDFKKIVGKYFNNCLSGSCGVLNDLIDNGGIYWYNLLSANSKIYYWESRSINEDTTNGLRGIRPVIRLDSNVLVTGGTGTYNDPYIIGNNTFWINGGAIEVAANDKEEVKLSLMTVNATQMCVSTDTSVCTDYVDFSSSYTLDWSKESAGEKVVYVYYKDSNGAVVAAMNESITLLDE